MTTDLIEEHHFLVRAPSEDEARALVDRFLRTNNLVRYDSYRVSGIRTGKDLAGGEALVEMEKENMARMRGICARLAEEGFVSLDSCLGIRQGYISKLFHTLAHLVDGFFGIDSFFYNLIEDSHQVSAALLKQMRESPEVHWLLAVEARMVSGDTGKGFHLI
ncbi:MAG: hypothetical protein AB1568_05355 [Thermodesulfobacteriota bacterium]